MADARTEVFEDDRGHVLRVTWHPDKRIVVVSVWADGTCVGTVHLDATDASKLSSLLVDSWVEALRLNLREMQRGARLQLTPAECFSAIRRRSRVYRRRAVPSDASAEASLPFLSLVVRTVGGSIRSTEEVEMGVIEENRARWAELDRLDEELCSLAAHMAAGMCRFLLLLAEFEAKGGHEYWGCHTIAQWLNMRLGVSVVTGREQARVARALGELPAITAAFAAGELSYSKVRALTRFARPETDADLAAMARHATASHLDRLAREMRGVRRQEEKDQANARHRGRFLHTYYDDDGSLIVQARLAPEDGAVVVAALEKAGYELARDASAEAVPSGDDDADDAEDRRGASRADALVAMAETVLGSGTAPADGPDRHRLFLQVSPEALRGGDGPCHLGDGTVLPVDTARRIACDAAVVAMVMVNGQPLCVADQTQTPPRRIRRALRARDGGCRWPGCDQRRWVDAHHIIHWADGGPTCLENLVLLCRRHHRRVHENGFTVEVVAPGRFEFRAPDGRLLAPATVTNASAEALVAAQQQLGIDDSTAVCQWGGERMDYALAIDGILSLEDRHRRLHQHLENAA